MAIFLLLLISCSGVGEEEATPDATATFQAAVSAELTRLAPTTSAVLDSTPTLVPTLADAPTNQPTPTLVPSPTLIPIVKQGAPAIRQGVQGDIFTRRDVLISADGEPPVYGDAITFFLVGAFDEAAGTNEGDGVLQVVFSIYDEEGQLVHEKVESIASYCAFGGDFPCEPYRFSQNNYLWSSGRPLESGIFRANIFAQGKNLESSANWTYEFQISLEQ